MSTGAEELRFGRLNMLFSCAAMADADDCAALWGDSEANPSSKELELNSKEKSGKWQLSGWDWLLEW